MNAPIPVPVPGPHPRISYAQNMEDILLDRLFPGQLGTYMDVGANHPLFDSNTQFFYQRGWRGVNVEPIGRLHALFQEHRPGDLNLAVAVSDAEGSLPFYEILDSVALSTLSAEVAEGHRARGLTVVEHRVPVRTVAGLIAEHRIEPPDFLCIDVESCEDRVIRGIPLDSWRPGVLVVESTIPTTNVACHQSWEPDLLGHGYLFGVDNGINRFYLRDDLADRLERLRRPVNVLDEYRRFEAVYLERHAHDLGRQADDLRRKVEDLTRQVEQVRAEQQLERAGFAEARAAWEWGQAQAAQAQADWNRHRAEMAQERASWAAALRLLEEVREQERDSWRRDRDQFERERQAWQDERGHHLRLLAEAHDQLRPYHLLDRLRVVPAARGWARRLRHRRVS
jgi:FkbM family methyltransferase